MALLPCVPGSHHSANGLSWLRWHLLRWRLGGGHQTRYLPQEEHSVIWLARRHQATFNMGEGRLATLRSRLRCAPTFSSAWRRSACPAWHVSLAPPQDPRRSFVFAAASTLSGLSAGGGVLVRSLCSLKLFAILVGAAGHLAQQRTPAPATLRSWANGLWPSGLPPLVGGRRPGRPRALHAPGRHSARPCLVFVRRLGVV